jgi:hypothetical protein
MLDRLAEEEIESLAALYGAPRGIAELAIKTFPLGTRMWALTYELAVEDPTTKEISLTDEGWRLAELAAARVRQPFADVTFSDVMAEGWAAIDELPKPAVDIKLGARYERAH